jgi:peptide/nickel transport system substrate-binding protein
MSSSTWRRGVVAVVAVTGLVTACSGSGDNSGDDSGDDATQTASIDRAATLRIGYAGPTATLDPAKQTLSSSQPSTFLLYDRLLQLDNDLAPQPMLAESWEFADDGSYLELTLRDGVSFHDGSPVDAAAVKATLERNKTLPGSTVATALADITTVEVVDPTTVRLNLVPGTGAGLPAILSSNAGEIISPTALTDGRDLGTAPGDAGSGPYVLDSFIPNELVTFTRAQGEYWDEDAALAERVEISFVPAAATRLNALRAGQLDVAHITGPDVATADQLGQSGAFEVHKVSVLTQQALYLDARNPLFADARVRQAISRAIDREAIAEDLLNGNCTPAVQPYTEGHWAHVDGLEEELAFDQDEARQLLSEAGASNLTFPLTYPAASSFEPVAQVVQSQLAEVGITVELNPLPSSDADASFRQGRSVAYVGSLAAVADPSQLLTSTYLGGYNAAATLRDQITPLADRADDPTKSQEERGELYGEIWTAVAEQATLVNICATKQDWAYQPTVVNVPDMPWTWAGNFDARYLGVTE